MSSIEVTFLEAEVHADVIVVDGLNITSLLLLAPLFLDLLLLGWIIDDCVVAIRPFLHQASIVYASELVPLCNHMKPLRLALLQRRLHLSPHSHLLLHLSLHPLHLLLLLGLRCLILLDLCFTSSPHR